MPQQFNCPEVHLQLPYPPTAVQQPNPAYARMMLDNMGGDVSEMSAVSLYLYNHLMTYQIPELDRTFYQVALVEMRHMEIFGTMARDLGADPRLWTQTGDVKTYWTPRYNRYYIELREMLQYTITDEQSFIDKYEYQLGIIEDPLIDAMLQRILADEYRHLEIFTCIYQQLMD